MLWSEEGELRHNSHRKFMIISILSFLRDLNILKYHLLQYITLLLMVFLIELAVGTLSYIYERNVPEEMNRTLSDTFMRNYGISERHTNAIDQMQQNFKCCGAVRFEEYRESVWLKSRRKDLIRASGNRLVPDSCCFSMLDNCGESDHPSNIPYTVSYARISI